MKINIDLLKDYRSDFSNEKSNFNSSSYGTFSSGYINRCSDNYVIRMRDKLKKLYQNIEKSYKNIDSWWLDYNNDIEGLERALSHDGRSGAIKASSIRSHIDSLPTLKNYSINFSGVINLNFEKAIPTFDMDSNNITFASSMNANTSKGDSLIDDFFAFLSNTGAAISEGWENSDLVHWLNNNVSPWLVGVNNNIYEVCENTMATVETGVISVGEGFLGFGESVIDSLAALSAASAEYQMNYDSNFQVIIDDNLGYFGEDTKYLWEQTQSFVSEEHVTTWFDNFYETSHGQDLVNNAYFFDTVRQVGSGIGHTFGVVSFSAATFGLTGGLGSLTGTMTATAALSGFGSGTEDAWRSGATIEEGVFTGLANASWEGFQWWIGGKIGAFDGKIGKYSLVNGNGKISSELLKSLFRIGADALDGGVEGFVQPLISGIYQDGYYDTNGNYIEFTENDNFLKRYAELFDDAGGWANVGIQTLIGGGSSLIGEVFDLSKILKESERQKIISNFREKMGTGTRSDQSLVDMLVEMAYKKGDDGFRILQTITKIKSTCPSLEFVADPFKDSSFWRHSEYKLQLELRYSDEKNNHVLAHELGHCLFDMVLGGRAPGNWDLVSDWKSYGFWDNVISRAELISSHNGTLELFLQESSDLRDNIYSRALQNFEYSIMTKYGHTMEQHRDFLIDQFGQVFQDKGKIHRKLIQEGLTLEQAYDIAVSYSDINTHRDLEKLVDADIEQQINNLADQILRTQSGGYGDLSDMIDAVYKGKWKDKYGAPGHGSNYYLEGSKNFPLHELIANFTSLKLNNEEAALKRFKEIFGTELYDYLDSIFNQFLDFGKNYGGV